MGCKRNGTPTWLHNQLTQVNPPRTGGVLLPVVATGANEHLDIVLNPDVRDRLFFTLCARNVLFRDRMNIRRV